MSQLTEQLKKIPADKKGHLALGLLLGLAFGSSVPLAIVVVLLAGAGKEAYDYVSNKYFGGSHSVELLDAVSTVIGGLAGIGVVQLIHHLL